MTDRPHANLSAADLEQRGEKFKDISDQELIAEVEARGPDDEFVTEVEVVRDCDCFSVRQEQPQDQEAIKAYYAMHRGDHETVRRYICDMAGKIA